jgi:hypothetical protein
MDNRYFGEVLQSLRGHFRFLAYHRWAVFAGFRGG